nr:RNA-directed DNA polymerase, eukaryota, reverse transcriptase zinc-binding domain protein [Tanacetum cinerariifolium]
PQQQESTNQEAQEQREHVLEEVSNKYTLSARANRGIPAKRYSPERFSKGSKYPMANIANGYLSEEAKESNYMESKAAKGKRETKVKMQTGVILINGSPTREFNIHRGFRQEDPLSPFLFIIAMEGLHVAVEDAMAAGLYKGFKINSLNLSHFFFADDALFIGDWSSANVKSLVSILECFHRVSGLKINYHKSNLLGVGVPFEYVELLATLTGCNAMASSLCYLGLPIDCNMALVKNWDPIIDKFSKSLSKWKASLLSIGGRSTLITSVLGAIGTHYFSLFPMLIHVNKKLESIRSKFFWGSDENSNKIPWIAWNLALAAKEKRGLGIGSLYSLNHALIQKWRWRFLNNPQALWARLIVSIHGTNEDASSFFSHVKNQGVWGRIIGSINNMHEKGFIPHSSIKRRANNVASTKFWHDTWIGNTSLQNQFPRLYRLAPNRDIMVRDCWNHGWKFTLCRNISSGTNANQLASLHNLLSEINLNDYVDIWAWYIETPEFTVKSARKHIDNNFLPDGGLATSRKGIDVASITCPICDCGIETSHHTLYTCSLAMTTSNTLYNAIMEAGGKDLLPMLAPDKVVPVFEGSPETTTETYMENYKNVSQDIRNQLNVEAEAVQIILTGIDNDI